MEVSAAGNRRVLRQEFRDSGDQEAGDTIASLPPELLNSCLPDLLPPCHLISTILCKKSPTFPDHLFASHWLKNLALFFCVFEVKFT